MTEGMWRLPLGCDRSRLVPRSQNVRRSVAACAITLSELWSSARRATSLASLLVVVACDLGSEAGGPPVLSTPAVLEVVGGADQVGTIGTRLPGAITVRVSDSRKEPVVGTSVLFDVTLGEGTLSPSTSKTDSNGDAQVEWTLGPDAGVQQIEARVVDARTGQVVLTARVSATATAP